MLHYSAGATRVLIDGFPRNKENLDGWEREMVDSGKMKTKFMLYFQCSEEECLKRAMGRNQNRSVHVVRIVRFSGDT
jgi:UMP-CMP kinase